jgi:hypothetical protein
MSRTRKSDRGFIKNRNRAFAQSDICWICGQWIDYTLKFPDPFSASGDHITPLSRGGHVRGEVAPAHLRCNQRRGRKMPPVKHGRDW